MICNMDCFNCTFDDCINDMSPRQVTMFIYNHSDKGKERTKRYVRKKIENGINADNCKAYYYSEKGIANREKNKKKRAKQMKKYQKKYIKSGKNAEACKRYYQRKKARILDTV